MQLFNIYNKYNNGIKIVLFFTCSFLLVMAFLLVFSSLHYKNQTSVSIQLIEKKFDQIKANFQQFLGPEYKGQDCQAFVQELRQSVFSTYMVKEAAIFNQQDQFFCSTTQGDVSFRLFDSIAQRLDEDPLNTTLSFTKTAVSQLKSTVLLFKNNSGEGISILIPPQYIYDLVNLSFTEHGLEYKIEVIDRDIAPQQLNSYMKSYRVESEGYPLAIESYIDYEYYLHYLFINSWLGFLLAGVSTIAVCSFKTKKISQRSLAFSLANALRKQHLQVFFQPIVDQKTKRIVGCESLLRWNDPIEGFVSPVIFIPLAESLGLIEDLTYFVLAKVFSLIQNNRDELSSRYISVNISRNVVAKVGFTDKVISMFAKDPSILKQVVFEVTEDGECSHEDMQQIRANLETLSKLGVRIAIDDFGTGYAGLDFVRQFDFSILKIDRVFVKNISEGSNVGIPLLESMILLAKTLNMQVIVEGVETQAQLKILAKLGVIYIQGFYFYRPSPEAVFIELLNEQDAE